VEGKKCEHHRRSPHAAGPRAIPAGPPVRRWQMRAFLG
jgi:hypothetical protein